MARLGFTQKLAGSESMMNKGEDVLQPKGLLPAQPRESRYLLPRLGLTVLAICCSMAACAQLVFAYKLSPSGTRLDQSVAKKYSSTFERAILRVAGKGVIHFTEPVHEEISNRIFGCQGDDDLCGDPDSDFAGPFVLAGVRWNDDPPFRLEEGEARNTSCKITETIRFTTQPICWARLFRDAEKKATEGKSPNAESRTSLLARSHFGDLQFLHAMASKDGEPAADTKKRIMMWAEFTWKVSRGDYGLDTKLKEVNIEGFDQFFGRTEWRVQDLFALGNPVLRRRIKDVAFGSLLHMVEDSFAKGHVERAGFGETCPGMTDRVAPGGIKEFHSYINQDSGKHGNYDSRNAFVEHWTADRPTVIEVGQVLLDHQERRSTWEEVKPYVECVFALEKPEAKASAGAGFKRK